jgi:hypothetical protein
VDKGNCVESPENHESCHALSSVSNEDLHLLRIEAANRERGVYEMAPEVEAALERYWVVLGIERQKLGIEHEINFSEFPAKHMPELGSGG